MKQSVWFLVLCAVLYVGASGRESKDEVKHTVHGSMGYGIELVLTKFDILTSNLKSIEKKIQSMEDKFTSVEDKFKSENKVQSINDSLRSVNGKFQSVENKVQLMGDNLRSVDGKILSVENKVQSMNDNLDNKFQSMNESLRCVDGKFQSVESQVQSLNDNLYSMDKKLQKSDSKLLQIENELQEQRTSQKQIVAELKEHIVTVLKDHQSGQNQNQKELLTAIQKLERQVAYNSSEVHNRIQENVQKELLKLKGDVDNVHNITRQIINALPQVPPTTEIPQKPEPVTTTVKSFSTTTTPKPKQPPYSSCKDVPSKVSGIYMIRVKSARAPFKVYCEQEAHGGGWIVFQYRYDGSVDFYRGWNEFRDGFGDLNKEFWLGLEKVHQITKDRKHELIVELKDFSGTYKYARYDAFEIGSESDQYNLKELGENSGNARDPMSNHNKGRKFSTKDRDNDLYSESCAKWHEGAWWHGEWFCTYANLNGRYRNAADYKSMYWWHFNDNSQGMSYSRMMIRELK